MRTELVPAGALEDSFPAMVAGGAPTPAIVKETIPASDDTDASTAETVAKMCEYIHAGSRDRMVARWAQTAIERYARGALSGKGLQALSACWAVFWLVKHSVKYVRDEPRLFRLGEEGALDLLIAPAVLVRMPQPKEDCDGFTMLICSMLEALGIRSYIVTVAASPEDPRRWSHVFPIAVMPDGTTCALDCSHGRFPGWMVPREHTFRWQAWSLDGRPADLKRPTVNPLHGYVARGRRGMGDMCIPGGIDPSTGDTIGSCGGGGGGIDWGSIINNAISGATRVAQTAFLPTGTSVQMTPAGQVVSASNYPYGGGNGPYVSGNISSSGILPWIIGGVALFAIFASRGSK